MAATIVDKDVFSVIDDPRGVMGRCVVAARELVSGETLLVEKPLLSYSCVDLPSSVQFAVVALAAAGTNNQTAAAVLQKFNALELETCLPKSKRTDLHSLQSAPFAENLKESISLAASHLDACRLLPSGTTVTDAARILGIAVLNAFDFEPSGTEAVFPTGCRFEHSCEPNIIFSPERRDCDDVDFCGAWRTIRSIAKGERLSVSYLDKRDLDTCASERRARLMQKQGFICSCTRCWRETSSCTISSGDHADSTCKSLTKGNLLITEVDDSHTKRLSWIDDSITAITLALTSFRPRSIWPPKLLRGGPLLRPRDPQEEDFTSWKTSQSSYIGNHRVDLEFFVDSLGSVCVPLYSAKILPDKMFGESDNSTECTGLALWPAGLLLASYLVGVHKNGSSDSNNMKLHSVLEIGSGPGLPALTAASLGAAHVVLSDVSRVALKLAELNSGTWTEWAKAQDPINKCKLRVFRLDCLSGGSIQHDCDGSKELQLASFDLILVSDLLYDRSTSSLPSGEREIAQASVELVRTIQAFLYPSACSRALISYQQRTQWDHTAFVEEFAHVARELDLTVRRISCEELFGTTNLNLLELSIRNRLTRF